MKHLLFCLIIGSLVACGRVGERAATEQGRLNARDARRLAAINGAHQRALSAVNLAWNDDGDADPGGGASPRGLAKMLDDQCETRQYQRPPWRTDRSWTAVQRLAGPRCPIVVKQTWTYDQSRRTLEYAHEFLPRELRGTKGMVTRRARGAISLGEDGAPTRNLVGSIHFDQYDTTEAGDVAVDVSVKQSVTRGEGAGEVRAEVRAGAWAHAGTLRWRIGRREEVTYLIDEAPVTRSGFDALFSAYGLAEIMAISLKMR